MSCGGNVLSCDSGTRIEDVYAVGPQGCQGSQGPPGHRGPPGDRGPVGTPGAPGNTGPQGPQGEPGPFGGLQGAQGNPGAPGPLGFQGPQGAAGAQGSQGVQGSQGPTGTGGYQGAQGVTGTQGATGAQGAQGATGAQGDSGPQGAQGAIGSQGDSGPQGAQGPQGSLGVAGGVGAQGAQGPAGAQGVQGAAGPVNIVTISKSQPVGFSSTATASDSPDLVFELDFTAVDTKVFLTFAANVVITAAPGSSWSPTVTPTGLVYTIDSVPPNIGLSQEIYASLFRFDNFPSSAVQYRSMVSTSLFSATVPLGLIKVTVSLNNTLSQSAVGPTVTTPISSRDFIILNVTHQN